MYVQRKVLFASYDSEDDGDSASDIIFPDDNADTFENQAKAEPIKKVLSSRSYEMDLYVHLLKVKYNNDNKRIFKRLKTMEKIYQKEIKAVDSDFKNYQLKLGGIFPMTVQSMTTLLFVCACGICKIMFKSKKSHHKKK